MPVIDDDPAIARFAESVRAFCTWAEGQPGTPKEEALRARLYLARLYAQVLDLPERQEWQADVPNITHETWQAMFQRFGALPFNYYGDCDDRLEVGLSGASIGDLADDLADIWRDVRSGLDLFDQGAHEAAAYQWQESFVIHWGQHAASALSILHYWIQQNLGVLESQAVDKG
jgi:hypothetical protein